MNNALWLKDWLVTAVTETETTRTATATYIPLPSTCPKCGSVDRLYRHGVKPVDYVDTPSAGKQLVIRAEVQRFRCRDCLETCMQPLPDIDTRRRMTKRCVQHIASQGVPRTYADLARSIGVDEKTIRNICNERFAIMLAERTIKTPVVLGIDEMTLAGRKRTVFVDVANKRFLDLIDAMNRGKVERWLLRLPDRERRISGPHSRSLLRTIGMTHVEAVTTGSILWSGNRPVSSSGLFYSKFRKADKTGWDLAAQFDKVEAAIAAIREHAQTHGVRGILDDSLNDLELAKSILLSAREGKP